MDRLWAPWRIKYIKEKKKKKCLFCQTLNHKKKNYLILKTKYSLVILNIFPYNNGHLMVAPLAHVPELSKLADAQALDLLRSLDRAKKLLQKTLKPDGFNIGINVSRSAGAGITGHLHVHIVPRWQGDTNFMPVVHNTKVISQSLDQLCRVLRHADS